MDATATTSASASATAARKRKRSEHGCVHAANDVLVEELKRIRSKIRESSHLAGNYGRAIFSLQNHPEPITSAQEAKQLRNIGNYIANQIQAILQKRQPGGAASRATAPSVPRPHQTPPSRPIAPVAAAPPQPTRPPSIAQTERQPPQQPRDSQRSKRWLYVPAHGKQPWYLLRALHDVKAVSEASALAMNLLLVKMQMAGYDGDLARLRACIAPLISTHEVIVRASSGALYLTPKGVISADFCLAGEGSDEPSQASSAPARDHAPVRETQERTTTRTTTRTTRVAVVSASASVDVQVTECIHLSDTETDPGSDAETVRATSPRYLSFAAEELEPEMATVTWLRNAISCDDLVREDDEWEIVLLLDHREVLSRRNRDILERKLVECDVTCEVRSLNVGDVQWVARRYRDGGMTVDELMLNVIVERKAVNDLSISIIDRRYAEQKTRLRDSGMTHVIYLVEGSLSQQTTVRTSGLQTALCRTQVQNKFFVQQCQSADESVAFLRGVHMSLLDKLPAQVRCRNPERSLRSGSALLRTSTTVTLDDWRRQFCQPVRSYFDFNAHFRKKTEFSVGEIYQMMLMQVHGLSSARTVALSNAYPTFQHLVKALERGGRIDELRYGEGQRRLGAKIVEVLQYLIQSTDYEKDTPSLATRTTSED